LELLLSLWELDWWKTIAYRCGDGHFSMFESCETISNPNSLSNSETGVDTRIRVWKKKHFEKKSLTLGSHCWWYLFHEKAKSWVLTTWVRIWQNQTRA
jgi:hypothetical protein